MAAEIDRASLYQQIGRLIEEMPTFREIKEGSLPQETHRWIGRAAAIVETLDDLTAKTHWMLAMQHLAQGLPNTTDHEIRITLYRLLGIAELQAPAGVRGSFIPAGDTFDAFAAIGKLLRTATNDILILDPYMDESALTDFGVLANVGVTLRLLSDQATVRPTLAPAATRWVTQHANNRPLQVRLAPPRALHDRGVFIDGSSAWTLIQSLKDFANRSPGEIVRGDDTAALKVQYYEDVWTKAAVVV